jgi:hypothetical protein
MKVRKIMGLLVCALVCMASFAWAGIPSVDLSTAVGAQGAIPVSAYHLPNGSGDRFDLVRVFGGGDLVDGTVTLTLLDGAGTPIHLYPGEDLWVDSANGGIVYCPGGTVADGATDVNGQTTWATAILAGLCEEYIPGVTGGLDVIINGTRLNQPPLPYGFNSSDLNGDLTVNITDVVIFAAIYDAYPGTYDYCGDFYWDGIINISDIVLLAAGFNTACP